MLEVNDFNAVRISLASPDQVRSWSYGEVKKPETINYRTLKPEKDGLFCERIFGPTKDFECYCGKYKRVRYKGIICDKCGVEVARSKVRRERMGHISLASPVSHIWYVKGTPSRLGLLLDISPRALERVLYFAQYVITGVDGVVKEQVLETLREEMDRVAAEREHEFVERLTAIDAERDRSIAAITEKVKLDLEEMASEQAERVKSVTSAAQQLQETLELQVGEAAEADCALGDAVVCRKGETVKPKMIEALKAELQNRLEATEAEFAQRRDDIELVANAATQQRRDAAFTEKQPIEERARDARTSAVAEYQERVREIEEDLVDPVEADRLTLVTDAKYREWTDLYPGLLTAGMGAEAILEILRRLDIDHLREKLQQEIHSSSGQRRKKATKRLRVVEALRKSGNRAEWMVVAVLPVLPPDLRPMVQLDGGRFATSDLNDLYRRVINRNNRLKRLLELGAPEIIIRNEKRMLQEAVDSLIDNGRRGRAVAGSGNHKLKSLSDMLKGKQGRFRQNLLGKRVDYSGRSVIVVGPELELHQCGLPRRMALELFKPFVMHALVAKGMAHNIKSAKRYVERARPEVWDVLAEVIRRRPVLLNRAPTLHRLGIQAFEPVLIDGSAIQIHPLVCSAFNADFDGDQMAVHVPLSLEAVAEARQIMLSTNNMLLPSSGEPTVAPTLDIVLGCFYLTSMKPGVRGEYKQGPPSEGIYGSFEEALIAHSLKIVDIQAKIRVRDARTNNEMIETSIGRIIFNQILPESVGFQNILMDRRTLKTVVAECYKALGKEETANTVDRLKDLGFKYATQSGVTIGMHDIKVPAEKQAIIEGAEKLVAQAEEEYLEGLISEEERYHRTVQVWRDATDGVERAIRDNLDRYGSVHMMVQSGAKGNITQIRQMAGMRGLMSDPTGRIIDLPIRSSFREGLSVLEYFISTHGARKGLADTALRTADSGYLTRRLIDVAQSALIQEHDCGTLGGIWLSRPEDPAVLETLTERIAGRYAASAVADPSTGEVLVEQGGEITPELAQHIESLGIEQVYARSALVCTAKRGLCQVCYGRDLATGELVKMQTAVGIIAAQSIGEPGTQLTMRTFHTGGVAGIDITSGLPRVEELFEARVPKGQALIAEIDGAVHILREAENARRIRIESTETYSDDYELPENSELLVQAGDVVEPGMVLAKPSTDGDGAQPVLARISGRAVVERADRVSIIYEDRTEREYVVPVNSRLLVEEGSYVSAGQRLTDGSINPQDMLRVMGREAVQRYLVDEVQKVYRSQGVNINDKHIEVIIRQLLRRVRVDSPGDTDFLPGELADRFLYEEANASVLAEGGEPATAQEVLLGVTKASLNTESFLAAASFQETTRVLTEAALNGSIDRLRGLKENVIIGKLIPAQAAIEVDRRPRPVEELRAPEQWVYEELDELADEEAGVIRGELMSDFEAEELGDEDGNDLWQEGESLEVLAERSEAEQEAGEKQSGEPEDAQFLG